MGPHFVIAKSASNIGCMGSLNLHLAQCSLSSISHQSEVLYESSDLVGDICSFAGGAFTNYFQIPKITAFIREATLCGFVDPFCLRVPRVYVRHAGSQIWQRWGRRPKIGQRGELIGVGGQPGAEQCRRN